MEAEREGRDDLRFLLGKVEREKEWSCLVTTNLNDGVPRIGGLLFYSSQTVSLQLKVAYPFNAVNWHFISENVELILVKI